MSTYVADDDFISIFGMLQQPPWGDDVTLKSQRQGRVERHQCECVAKIIVKILVRGQTPNFGDHPRVRVSRLKPGGNSASQHEISASVPVLCFRGGQCEHIGPSIMLCAK